MHVSGTNVLSSVSGWWIACERAALSFVKNTSSVSERNFRSCWPRHIRHVGRMRVNGCVVARFVAIFEHTHARIFENKAIIRWVHVYRVLGRGDNTGGE